MFPVTRAYMPSLAHLDIPRIRHHRLLQDGRRASPDNETRCSDYITTYVQNEIFKFVSIECESRNAANLISWHSASVTSQLRPIKSVQCLSPAFCTWLSSVSVLLLTLYSPVVTIYTTTLAFNNSTFCPQSIFMCFVWISEQTTIISLYSINWLVFITEIYPLQPSGYYMYRQFNIQ